MTAWARSWLASPEARQVCVPCDTRGRLSAASLAVALFVALAACSREPAVVLTNAKGESVRVTVEIADTPEKRAVGLMYRKSLAEERGMLFRFEREADHNFWMKNTEIPLDMIFIAPDGRIVGIVENAEPFSLAGRGVGAPSRFVLEVPGGFSDRHSIAAGDRAELP